MFLKTLNRFGNYPPILEARSARGARTDRPTQANTFELVYFILELHISPTMFLSAGSATR